MFWVTCWAVAPKPKKAKTEAKMKCFMSLNGLPASKDSHSFLLMLPLAGFPNADVQNP